MKTPDGKIALLQMQECQTDQCSILELGTLEKDTVFPEVGEFVLRNLQKMGKNCDALQVVPCIHVFPVSMNVEDVNRLLVDVLLDDMGIRRQK